VEQGGREPSGGMINELPLMPPENAGAGVTPERDRAMQPTAPERPLRPPDPGSGLVCGCEENVVQKRCSLLLSRIMEGGVYVLRPSTQS